jgi:hypothetical protein
VVAEDVYSTFEFWGTCMNPARLHEFSPPNTLLSDSSLLALARKRIKELREEQAFLYQMFTEEEEEKEGYMRLYESEKKRREELERRAWRTPADTCVLCQEHSSHDFEMFRDAFGSLCEVCRSACRMIVEVDQKIMMFLSRELLAKSNYFDLVLWTTYFLTRSEKDRARLQAGNTELANRIRQIESPKKLQDAEGYSNPQEMSPTTRQPLTEGHNSRSSADCKKPEDSPSKPWTEEDLEDFNSRWWRDLPAKS